MKYMTHILYNQIYGLRTISDAFMVGILMLYDIKIVYESDVIYFLYVRNIILKGNNSFLTISDSYMIFTLI